ncbi:MAG: hypothetical protein U0Q12_11780, partial [Vicinamibacterales bacterium]
PAWATGVSYPNDLVPLFCFDDTNPPTNVKNHPDCHNPTKVPTQAAVREFVRQVTNRYKHAVRAFGIGAEAHSLVFWQGTIEQFVGLMLRPAYEEIKAIDPSIIVVGPDEDLEGSLSQLLSFEASYGRWADVLAFHLLKHSLAPNQTAAQRLDTQLKPIVDQLGRGRPLWLTEVGFLSPNAAGNTIAGQWLAETLAAIRARPWIDKTFLLRLKELFSDAFFGLLNADDSPRPQYFAVKQFVDAQATPRFAYLAEGATGAFFDLDIALANPNAGDAPVKLSFLKEDGSVTTASLVMAPKSRTTVNVDNIPGVSATATSTVVESTAGQPIVVERTMFWDATRYAGHGGTAVSQPETKWYFAEGSQGFFDTYVLLANSNIAPAQATVTFLLEQGAPVVVPVTVGANARLNVFAGSIPALAGTSFSIVVDADQPIIAERAMYFSRPNRFWLGGHESAGVARLATSWFLAEGATGDYFDTYVLVGNPNPSPAAVTLSFLLPNGTHVDKPYTVGAQSRMTVYVDGADVLLANTAVSTTVTSDIPVVVERAMYWPGAFTTWAEAHNSFGVTETGVRWGLAEGRQGGAQNFESYILIANPTTQSASVDVTLLRPDGVPVAPIHVTVSPTSRLNIEPGTILAALGASIASFGATVESTNGVPIVVERAMYWDGCGAALPAGVPCVAGGAFWQHWKGGTNATATKLP